MNWFGGYQNNSLENSFTNITKSQISASLRKVTKDFESTYLLKFGLININVNNEHNYSFNFIPPNNLLNICN